MGHTLALHPADASLGRRLVSRCPCSSLACGLLLGLTLRPALLGLDLLRLARLLELLALLGHWLREQLLPGRSPWSQLPSRLHAHWSGRRPGRACCQHSPPART